MSSAKQNRSIARLVVGAMTIDGSLSKQEQQKVARTLERIGFGELIADVGATIEEDDGNFSMHKECELLFQSLGSEAKELAPIVFRVIADVIASDRFVSSREALYLTAVAKRLQLPLKLAQTIFKQVLAEKRGRLEISAEAVDPSIHPQLKELLSFVGSEKLVGPIDDDSIEGMLGEAEDSAKGASTISREEVARAMTILGLKGNAKLSDAEEVWRETIENLNLPKMSRLGETFVSAAINRITRINEAYKTILQFDQNNRLGNSKSPVGTIKA